MKKNISKRFMSLLKSAKDRNPENIENAIKKVKANCTAKFDESIDISLKLNLKRKKEEIVIRTAVNLPNGNGKKLKIAVLCEESKSKEAKESGADFYNTEKIISDINSGKINFDKIIATPAMMPKMGKLGKILGPKGLMPNPKLGTVTNDITAAVKALKSGQIEIKNDSNGNVGASIGKKSFPDNKIKENFNSLIETINKEKPTGIKGDFIISAFLTSTMGLSYKIKFGK